MLEVLLPMAVQAGLTAKAMYDDYQSEKLTELRKTQELIRETQREQYLHDNVSPSGKTREMTDEERAQFIKAVKTYYREESECCLWYPLISKKK